MDKRVPVGTRLLRLERGQRQTNEHLARIEDTLATSSRLFELMHDRLVGVEAGQQALVEGQRSLVEGQNLVIERLDRLVEATIRDRTGWAERLSKLEQRVEIIEDRLDE